MLLPSASAEDVLVLVVDDNEIKRYTTRRMLERAGIAVCEAIDGESALRAIRERRPAVTVLDINLPDISGIEVCRQVKADPETASVLILHLTAHRVSDADTAFGLQSGADAYLSVPVDAEVLVGTVQALLRLHHAEALTRKAAEQATTAFRREKRIAETLQNALLTSYAEHPFPDLEIESVYVPAWDEALVGGDLFDMFSVGTSSIALVVADASGKGLAAAARTAEIKYALRAFLWEDPDPATALFRLNNFVCRAQDEDRRHGFVTAAIVVLDRMTGLASACAAAAEPPLILRANGAAEVIDAAGAPLGVEYGEAYAAIQFTMEVGDAVLLATDGITEARRGHEFFGYDRLVAAASAPDCDRALRCIGENVLAEAGQFAGSSLTDDVCLLLARRLPAER
jgi:serine phosphatase RsbU (regulator of sigma subunit)